ncbi:MAG: sigma 54-interacting transcriptional regulator [Deltaproteobacteria bacterium]|nr:sigma 54-interacting transcriptional regulator [Deltaproteobacteria bacterium]
MRVRITLPQSETGTVLSVEPGITYLIGRKPDPLRLSLEKTGAPRGNQVKPVAIEAAGVSRNHVLLWLDAGSVVVHDLGSRNGSRLRVPRDGGARVEGAAEIVLDLAPVAGAQAPFEKIPDAEWSAGVPFAVAVKHSIEAWLQKQGMEKAVRIESVSDGARMTDERTLRLADGKTLLAGCDATEWAHWTAAWDVIRTFVHDQNARFAQEQGHGEVFVCASPAFRRAHEAVCRAAERGLPLVLLGPTGSGKDVLARCYHNHSAWRDKQFIALFCGPTPDEQQLSVEIFGARKGSYTSLAEDRVGAVESADGGTLFIDEIGDVPPGVQLMLLRFLDSGEYRRLGDRWEAGRHAGVHLVCATLKDLPAEVRRGAFREDLWNRINVVVVRVPPLKDRKDDVIEFLRQRRLDNGVALVEALGPGCLEIVLAHDWPGNFRDLNKFRLRLPQDAAAGTVSRSVCREALAGASPVEPRPAPMTGHSAAIDWQTITERASQAFVGTLADAAPVAWKSLADYSEKYLKPLVVAHACGVLDDEASTPEVMNSLNFSDVARRLGMADGQRAKKYLQDYFAIYRRP